jgi:hypothetical protein
MKAFCDESSIDGQPHFLIGSVWVPNNEESRIRRIFDEFRKTPGLQSAVFKWTSVVDKDPWWTVYRGWIDTFCHLSAKGSLEYRCIIVPTAGIDHKTYNNGDPEAGFYKFYYQLLYHRMRRSAEYHYAYLASRGETPSDVDQLARILNNALHKQRTGARVLSVNARAEREDTLIQLADLLTGAVSYHVHKRHLKPDAKKAKKDLAHSLARQLKRSSLAEASAPNERRFNVWHFKLRPKS